MSQIKISQALIGPGFRTMVTSGTYYGVSLISLDKKGLLGVIKYADYSEDCGTGAGNDPLFCVDTEEILVDASVPLSVNKKSTLGLFIANSPSASSSTP